jgi:Flp pilus assembly pilin Flp
MNELNRRHSRMLDERGQTMAEYSVLVAFIAIVAAAAVPALGNAVLKMLTSVTGFIGG